MEQVDYRKKLDEYLLEKLRQQNDPDYGKDDREEMAGVRESDRRNALASSLMKSAAQMGTIGGKAADTSSVDDMATRMAGVNKMRLGEIGDRRAQADKQFGINADVYKYLAEKQTQQERMSKEDKYRADTLAQNKSKADREAAAKEAERAENKRRYDADREIKERELSLKETESNNALASKTKNLTEAEKVVDKEFAQEYNAWTSGGAKSARLEIDKLKGVADSLRKQEVTTGGLTGVFPDRITSNRVLKARADVESTVMNSLRAILGAAFTEKEGQRIIKATWNEADSTENNLARLDRLVSDLENKASDKNNKARYLEANGTLKGYQMNSSAIASEGGPMGGPGTATAGQDKVDPKIADFARKNRLDYGRAAHILKQRGYTPDEQ
jgi:hypothetical protein